MSTVVMYTTGMCQYCLRAKRLLGQYGVVPAEIRVDNDPDKREEMVERSGGMHSVPQVFINGKHIGGFDQLNQLHSRKMLGALLSE